jgi:hypothetical protein
MADSPSYPSATVPAGTSGSAISTWTTPTTLAADQNDYILPAGGKVRLNNSATVNITGFTATTDGDERVLVNIGLNALTIKHQSASSLSANRVQCVSASDIVLSQYDAVQLIYDGTSGYWRAY